MCIRDSRMPVFFVGVALSTGFPCLVLMVVMAVIRRAGGTLSLIHIYFSQFLSVHGRGNLFRSIRHGQAVGSQGFLIVLHANGCL